MHSRCVDKDAEMLGKQKTPCSETWGWLLITTIRLCYLHCWYRWSNSWNSSRWSGRSCLRCGRAAVRSGQPCEQCIHWQAYPCFWHELQLLWFSEPQCYWYLSCMYLHFLSIMGLGYIHSMKKRKLMQGCGERNQQAKLKSIAWMCQDMDLSLLRFRYGGNYHHQMAGCWPAP